MDSNLRSDTPAAGPSVSKKRPPRCHIPWQQMVIDSTGAAVPCCYWGAYENDNPPIGNINEQSIEEIWNGPGYQKLRAGMAKGDLKAAGCGNCYAVKQGMGLAFEHDPACDDEPADQKSRYARNMDILRREIAVGATVLEAKPTVVSFTPSHRCNIRCTHCYQESTRTEEISRQRAQDEVVALAPYLVRLVAGGGEPFLLPIWNKFLAEFDLRDNPYLDFATSTNATIVSDKILDGLKRFKKLTVNVSLDGTGAAYDKVRVGAKFDRVVENIRKLRQVVGSAESHESAIGVSMCVMKSNILDLPNFVRFNTVEGLAFGLSPVTTLPPDESLRCFNDRAVETKGWAEAIDEAERLVQEEYLPAMVQRRNENVVQQVERDFWSQNFKLLRQAIDRRDAELVHRRVKSRIPDLLTAGLDVGPDKMYIAYIARLGAESEAGYWAPLVDRSIDVMLPAGDYTINISSKWVLPEYLDIVRLHVPEHGEPTVSVARHASFRGAARDQAPYPTRRIRLPHALLQQFPFLTEESQLACAFLFELGRPEASYLAKSPVNGNVVEFAVPDGRYCLAFSPTPHNPGYWDVVRFEATSDPKVEVTATYHHVTSHRIRTAYKKHVRRLFAR
jgi:radical SAM protein with 4Fe4S-binding SPASM domain